MHESHSLEIPDFNLHYLVKGSGPTNMMFFHGFGQSADIIFNNNIDFEQYTIYSFELFCHGKSTISDPLFLSKEALSGLISAVIEKHQIVSFELCAYSLGAKYALAILFELDDLITKTYLIAPDGFIKKKSYTFATANKITTALFELAIAQASWMIHIPKSLSKVGVLPLKTVEFVQKQLSNSSRKKILVDSWLSVKHLSYNLRELLKRLPSGPPIMFYVGKHDPVISAKQIKSISDRLPNSNCITLDEDHNKVRYSALAKIFNNQN